MGTCGPEGFPERMPEAMISFLDLSAKHRGLLT
jgi:hypothetical protein